MKNKIIGYNAAGQAQYAGLPFNTRPLTDRERREAQARRSEEKFQARLLHERECCAKQCRFAWCQNH